MKKNRSIKQNKPMNTALLLLIWFFVFSAVFSAGAYLFLENDYASWHVRYENTIEKKAYSAIQRIQRTVQENGANNLSTRIQLALASDANTFPESGEMYACLKERETGSKLADSAKRIYLVLPGEETDSGPADEPMNNNLLYLCDDNDIMDWMEQTEAAGANARPEEIQDDCHILFRLKEYELYDDGSFLPKQIVATDVNIVTGQEKTIGIFSYPQATETVNESVWEIVSSSDPIIYIVGSNHSADAFPQDKAAGDREYRVSCSESHTYQYGRELEKYYSYHKYFWKGDFVYIRKIPFVCDFPADESFKSTSIVVFNENGQFTFSTDDSSNNLVLEYYFKSNYPEERMKGLLFRGLIYYIPLLLISSVFVFVIHKRKIVKYEKEQYRRTLTDSLSHDLKSPITALRGYAESLKENLNTEKRDVYADAILESSDYMDRLINGNMELIKLEEMGRVRNKENTDLVKVSEELFVKYKPVLEEKGITLTITGDYQRKANKELITRALENLVSNAVKYTNKNGSITLIGGKDELSLSNTTSSFPDRKPDDLWEPFVKGNDSRTGEDGNGLGLAIAKRIFNMHKFKSKITYTNDNIVRIELK